MHLILVSRPAPTRLASQRYACEGKYNKSLIWPVRPLMTKTRRDVKNKRTRRLNVFFDALEYDQLRAEAEQAGMRPSELMRQKFFNSPPTYIPHVNLEAWRKLSSASANLNQIARNMNSTVKLEIDEVASMLSGFRMALVSASQSNTA